MRAFAQLVFSEQVRKDFGGVFGFLYQFAQTRPQLGSATSEIWSVDHLAALSGMLSENFVRSEYIALMRLMKEYEADVVVDALHPVACMAARILGKPLVTIIQSDMHPDSGGFIWWKEPPPHLPTPIAVLNKAVQYSSAFFHEFQSS